VSLGLGRWILRFWASDNPQARDSVENPGDWISGAPSALGLRGRSFVSNLLKNWPYRRVGFRHSNCMIPAKGRSRGWSTGTERAVACPNALPAGRADSKPSQSLVNPNLSQNMAATSLGTRAARPLDRCPLLDADPGNRSSWKAADVATHKALMPLL